MELLNLKKLISDGRVKIYNYKGVDDIDDISENFDRIPSSEIRKIAVLTYDKKWREEELRTIAEKYDLFLVTTPDYYLEFLEYGIGLENGQWTVRGVDRILSMKWPLDIDKLQTVLNILTNELDITEIEKTVEEIISLNQTA
jgi:hypothetical protein